MTRRRVGLAAGFALGCLLAWPAAARAQSSIGGTVKDSSGGVLPGVTVEVSSPALIEGTKAATTDGGGTYRIVDLRPGMYTVKFTLTGFATVERAAFQLLSDFNARIDAELKVGALEETITVTGAAPIVDVTSAAKVAVLDRDALDNVPTGKTIPGLGQLIVGVSLSSPDVGGSAGAMNTYMSIRGGTVGSQNNTIMVDGMVINGLQGDGSVQTYTNDGDFQEMSYQTAGIGAERSGGGVTVNLIPKEGGNRFSGSSSALYRPGQLQALNYSDRFKLWGLPVDKDGKPAINRIKRISDLNVAEGGPIKKDTLWFFVSGRDFQPINTVPNTFVDNGSQGLDDNYIRNTLVRLTYQASSRHKVSAYYERVFKWRGHDMNAYDDPETAARVWTSPNYSTGSVKYTGTISNHLLVEGGYSQNLEFYRTSLSPGVAKVRGTPEWYATVSRLGTGFGRTTAIEESAMRYPLSKTWVASASYVTGAHHVKAGLSLHQGPFHNGTDGNADLQQVYPSAARNGYETTMPSTLLYDTNPALFATLFPSYATGAPCNTSTGTSTCSVTIRNNPRLYTDTLNQDLGIYAQDSFTLKRLTLNGGLRWEHLRSEVSPSSSPLGRFVPQRDVTVTKPDIPNWKDWAPRFQMVFDVFGNSKTAVKYSANRYNEAQTTSLADSFNPNQILTATSSRNWTDLNRDDIAQGQRTFNADGTFTDCVYLTAGCEINLSGTASQTKLSDTFGALTDPGVYGGFRRRYRIEQGVEIQHALLPRLSLTGTYYHGWSGNLTKVVNRARTDDGTAGTQYRPVALFSPIDGTPYLYYNNIVTLATDNLTYVEPKKKSVYDTYTAEMQMRPYAGAQLSGGLEMTRVLNKDCGTSAFKADGVTPAIVDPNEARFCDDRNLVAFAGGPRIGKPYTKNFKMSGAFPVFLGINLGLSYQNIDSGGVDPTFRYGTAFTYLTGSTNNILGKSTAFPACPTTYGCVPGSVTVPSNWVGGSSGTLVNKLVPVGTVAEERIAQLDLKASRNFRFGRISIQPAFEAFNLLNIDQIRSRLTATGAGSGEIANASGTYLQPNNMLQGRIIGFGANIKW